MSFIREERPTMHAGKPFGLLASRSTMHIQEAFPKPRPIPYSIPAIVLYARTTLLVAYG